jgi:vacuolar protein sorting-associated protein VTA1
MNVFGMCAARFLSVQRSLKIDKSSEESKDFIIRLLNWLEFRKKELAENEAITNEAVAEAHIENYAIKLFKWADSSDRNRLHNK